MNLINTRLPVSSLENAHDVRLRKGTLRKAFEMLLSAYYAKRRVSTGEVAALKRNDPIRRVRQLREGFTTDKLRSRGMMIWVDYDHRGYALRPVLWEEWVKLWQEHSKKHQMFLFNNDKAAA